MPEFNPMARVVALCLAGLLANAPLGARAQAPSVALDGDDIGGIVAGPNGPEAGVWVIAETTDLPTKLAKIVVTDEQGRVPVVGYDFDGPDVMILKLGRPLAGKASVTGGQSAAPPSVVPFDIDGFRPMLAFKATC